MKDLMLLMRWGDQTLFEELEAGELKIPEGKTIYGGQYPDTSVRVDTNLRSTWWKKQVTLQCQAYF